MASRHMAGASAGASRRKEKRRDEDGITAADQLTLLATKVVVLSTLG